MEGGIHSLKGFIYQATVILDELLPHFDRRDARARPEGADDLELVWSESGGQHREFIQIKKPREDDDGRLKREAWSLREVVQELLSKALGRLRDNEHAQRWILGDAVDPEVQTLVDAAHDAPYQALTPFLHTIHLLAREQSKVTEQLSKEDRRSIGQWRYEPPTTALAPEGALEGLIAGFTARITGLSAAPQKLRRYAELARAHYRSLPGILARIRVQSTFGREDEVRARVCDRVGQTYPLSRERVEHTVFGNMRQFVDDIAVRKHTWLDRDMLDELVTRVWPEMMLLREPPPLPEPHIERPDLVEQLFSALPRRALEVVGIAGSGKTSLARAVYDHVKTWRPDLDVVYAEVRRDRTLREVLTGLAFHMRRRGDPGPRDAAVLSGITEEERAREVARALHAVGGATLLLVDLVGGDCDDEFARLLSIFVQEAPAERLTLMFFGQESALRGLTPLERELAGIPPSVEQSGFQFEEFVRLVSFFYADVDRPRLWNVYQRATAGRRAGLFARLAYDLARSPSLEAMERIVAEPPDKMVPRAVRERFERLSTALRPAADKLACLLLPFRREQAMEIFPDDRISAAIDKLLELGLLNHHDAARLEMHETVRRSAEADVPPAPHQEAHRALASWYGRHGRLLAEIHHLDRAGQREEAHRKARQAFLAGEHEYALMDYVAEHGLVTGAELAESLLSGTRTDRLHIIPRLLRRLGDSQTAELLIAGLQAQDKRFDSDFQWAWSMIEAILACDPEGLYELAEFGLSPLRNKDTRTSERRFELIVQGARRIGGSVDPRLLALFDAQDGIAPKKWTHFFMPLAPPPHGRRSSPRRQPA